MHNKRIAKLLILALSLAILVGSAIGILVSASDAKAPVIISNNVSYGGNFSLMYAVDADSVNGNAVTLDIYAEAPAEGVSPIATYTSNKTENIEIEGTEKTAYVFTTAGVAAKDMGDVFYAVATDASGASSAVYAYSVAEYMLDRLYGDYTTTDAQKALYTASLATGANAQRVLINEKDDDASNDEVLVTDYTYLTFKDGTVNGKSERYHIVKKGDVVALAHNPIPEGHLCLGLGEAVSCYYIKDSEVSNNTSDETTELVEEYTVTASGSLTLSHNLFVPYYNRTEIPGTRLNFDDGVVPSQVFLNNDKGNTTGADVNGIAIVDSNGNKALQYTSTAWWGFGIKSGCEENSYSSGKYVIEADLTFTKFTAKSGGQLFAGFLGSGDWTKGDNTYHNATINTLAFKDSYVVSTDPYATWTYFGYTFNTNTTYKLSLVYDIETNLLDMYVNGILVVEDYAGSSSKVIDDSVFIGLFFYPRAANCVFTLDNVFLGVIDGVTK